MVDKITVSTETLSDDDFKVFQSATMNENFILKLFTIYNKFKERYISAASIAIDSGSLVDLQKARHAKCKYDLMYSLVVALVVSTEDNTKDSGELLQQYMNEIPEPEFKE